MSNSVSAPVPTFRMYHEPPAAGIIMPPSATATHDVPNRPSKPTASLARESMVASSGVLVGIMTTAMLGSGYSPSSPACIDHLHGEVMPSRLNTPDHSNAADSAMGSISVPAALIPLL